MDNIAAVTESLQIALKEAGEAEKKYADALAGIKPLEAAAIEKRNAVNVLMSQYQELTTGAAISTHQKSIGRRGGAGKKRGPRSLAAISMTSGTRLLNEEHKAGKKKLQAVNAALDRVAILAAGRNEKVTDEIKASIAAKAEEIWKK